MYCHSSWSVIRRLTPCINFCPRSCWWRTRTRIYLNLIQIRWPSYTSWSGIKTDMNSLQKRILNGYHRWVEDSTNFTLEMAVSTRFPGFCYSWFLQLPVSDFKFKKTEKFFKNVQKSWNFNGFFLNCLFKSFVKSLDSISRFLRFPVPKNSKKNKNSLKICKSSWNFNGFSLNIACSKVWSRVDLLSFPVPILKKCLGNPGNIPCRIWTEEGLNGWKLKKEVQKVIEVQNFFQRLTQFPSKSQIFSRIFWLWNYLTYPNSFHFHQDIDEEEDKRDAHFRYITEITILTVQLIVEFAKGLPAFTKIPQEDQITLLKVNESDCLTFKNYKLDT